jgi:hypothetical protein
MNPPTLEYKKILRHGLAMVLSATSFFGIAARTSDVNLIVHVSDCTNGSMIEGAMVEVPTASADSASSAFTDDKGVARIYPLRSGGQEHEIRVQANGFMMRTHREQIKEWSSVEADICLLPKTNERKSSVQEISLIRWSDKFPIPQPPPTYEECQCVTYWSRSELGRVLPLGVAGLSPDLMVKLDFFGKIPDEYGKWKRKTEVSSGDTVIIQPDATLFLYSFTGNTYSKYTQLRPGHIGVIESSEKLNGVPIDLVGKHYDAFNGWHIRFRNANWPSEWMENNHFYPEHIGDGDNEMVCKNVGLSDIIVQDKQELITFWGRE